MIRKIHWGVLGCAQIAERCVIPGILQADNAELTAVASRGTSEKLERFRRKFGPGKTYESYEELLEDPEVEAVYLPLPNGLHCEWAIRAMEKKKHVLCEKPLATSASEVLKMKEVSERCGVLLMEAFAYRQSPLTRKVKSLLDSGAVGTPHMILSWYGFSLQNLSDVRNFKELGGGATYDVGCYNINLIRTLAGCEPERIHAVGEIGENGIDLESAVTMEFPNGIRAVSTCGFDLYKNFGYQILGECGLLRVDSEFNSKGTNGICVETEGETQHIAVRCPDNYMLEIEQFSRAVFGGESPLITLEDSLGNAKVIDESLRQIFK